ncbi:uncharacterized protein LOC110710785 [Chenopodium quinoa]|uniref:uncharacterized protein LOC110710785 n=1 Tax=Chenopodium quinoa TaxID=63459 RepID=UPI000B76CCA6|nr:uncharacterized protein LOC110710785 [Chenopodium quinoa]
MPIRFTKSPLTPFSFNGVSDTIYSLAPPSHNHYHHHLTTIITTIILSLSLSSIPSSSSTMEKLWRPALKSIFLSPPKPSPSAIITAFSSSSRRTLTTLSSLSVFLSPASNFASSKTLNPSKPSSFLLLFCRDCRCFSSVSPLDTNRFEWNGPISCSEVVDAVSIDDTDENGDVDTRAAVPFSSIPGWLGWLQYMDHLVLCLDLVDLLLLQLRTLRSSPAIMFVVNAFLSTPHPKGSNMLLLVTQPKTTRLIWGVLYLGLFETEKVEE